MEAGFLVFPCTARPDLYALKAPIWADKGFGHFFRLIWMCIVKHCKRLIYFCAFSLQEKQEHKVHWIRHTTHAHKHKRTLTCSWNGNLYNYDLCVEIKKKSLSTPKIQTKYNPI